MSDSSKTGANSQHLKSKAVAPATKGTSTPIESPAIGFTPALTEKQSRDAESLSASFDPNRRIILSVLTKSSGELVNSSRKDMDALTLAIEHVGNFIDQHKALLEFAKAAQARLLIVAAEIPQEQGENVWEEAS